MKSEFSKIAIKKAKELDESALFCEIGTRSGDSALVLLKAINNSKKLRWLFTIDPYGNKEYEAATYIPNYNTYGDQHHRDAMYLLSKYAFKNNLLHNHWRMTSFDFISCIESIDFFYEGRKIDYKFGFVYLDGEHSLAVVQKEFAFFKERMVPGGVIIIDDADYMLPDSLIGPYGLTLEQAVKNEFGETAYVGESNRIVIINNK
jgi:hypothetical protein